MGRPMNASSEKNNSFSYIQDQIDSDPIVLYMKGSKEAPMCGFSAFVCGVLKKLAVPFQDYNVMQDQQLRSDIKTFSNWPTIPQLYIKGQFIGGCDIVKEMYASGKLEALLKESGIV